MKGAAGLIYGGVSGVWQATHPVIKSLSTGIHWFAFGTSYWGEVAYYVCSRKYANILILALRSFILKEQFDDKASPAQKSYVSALSGGLSGGAVNWAVSKCLPYSPNSCLSWKLTYPRPPFCPGARDLFSPGIRRPEILHGS